MLTMFTGLRLRLCQTEHAWSKQHQQSDGMYTSHASCEEDVRWSIDTGSLWQIIKIRLGSLMFMIMPKNIYRPLIYEPI